MNRSSLQKALIRSGDLLLSEGEAADYLGVRKETLSRWRCDGCGPKFTKVGKRKVRYRKRKLDEWLESRTHQSTSESADARSDEEEQALSSGSSPSS